MEDRSLEIDQTTEENKWFIFNIQQTGTLTCLTVIHYNNNFFSFHITSEV